uniref:Uncharacterized protein n=1 Tax=Cannabis sativa TaxID=3483 RepID=A0A803QTJ0_CANSA
MEEEQKKRKKIKLLSMWQLSFGRINIINFPIYLLFLLHPPKRLPVLLLRVKLIRPKENRRALRGEPND